jgi:DMSO/TMAO reductase YedYZ molybdopterin-dependent catalytic subunit
MKHVLAVCALLAAAPAIAQTPPLQLSGMVQHPQSFSMDQLRSMPSTQVELTFTTMHGPNHHTWTGVKLWDLISRAALRDEPGRRTQFRHVLLATGQDGYGAAFAVGEIDPAVEGKPIILAYRQDNTDIPAIRLIVPNDKEGARDVHDVVSIDVR